MADSPEGTQTAPAETGGSVFDEARAAIAQTEPTPSSTPDAAEPTATKPTEPTPAPSDDPAKADEPAGTRRQKGEEAYQRGLEEGRRAAETERQAREAAEAAERTAREQRESLAALIKRAKEGDWEAAQQLADLEEGKLAATDTQAKELALFAEAEKRVFGKIAADFGSLKDVEGIDAEGFAALMESPSVSAFGRKAFDLGAKSRDSEITTLKTQLRAAEGKLAGKSPSPLGANGLVTAGGTPTAGLTGMRRAFAEAVAEQRT